MQRFKLEWMAAAVAVFWMAAAADAADVAKIGVIDIQRVVETSSAGKAALAEIKKQKEKMEAALQEKMDEVQQLRKQLERDAMVMSKEMREEKEREGRIKVNDLKTMEKKYRAELQQQQQKFLGRIQKDVFELVEEIGKKEGYLLIVNKVGVLYAPTSIDITDQLIQKYNAAYAQKMGG